MVEQYGSSPTQSPLLQDWERWLLYPMHRVEQNEETEDYVPSERTR